MSSQVESLFTKIINREIVGHIVAENDLAIAFLDVKPLAKGHTLIVPKVQTDYLFDLDDTLYASLWSFAKGVAIVLKGEVPCKRIGVAVIGLEVPHAHIHLVPLQRVEDINFSGPRLTFTDEEQASLASKLLEKWGAQRTE